jgi:glycosyltransferase involved in cell wall biosynthesis
MTLLLDALDRCLKEPQCALRWHGLVTVWEASPEPAARQAVIAVLRGVADGDARADVLRLTFLAGATGESRHEHEAAARVLAIEPEDQDRLAACMAFRWLSALQDLNGRPDFIAALAGGRVPEMAARLMLSAVATIPAVFRPRVPEEVRRIAVVVPYVGHQFHTPSMMAVEQCAVLAREGCQVRIFSAQELTPPDARQFRGDGRDLNLPPLNAQVWGKLLPAGVGMTISDSRFSLPGRWRKLMPVLAEFDPDAVLLVGLFSPLAAALHTLRPVVGISVNSVPPIAPVDVWLGAGQEATPHETWGGVFPPPLPVFHPWKLRRSTKQWPVTRAEFGLDDDAVIWITAGFRLEHEIKGDWAKRMLQMVSRHQNVVWLLVGGEGKLPEALRSSPPGRICALATRDDLPGILRCSDIYVNPPRMGGGLSVAEAMAEGLPVTSLSGSDGGDKVGKLALPDLDAYMERLAALTCNPLLRKETGETLRRRFGERFDLEASGPPLLAAFRQAATLAGKRLTGAS